jgi:DNA-binding NarL/FixJ family response regulator
MTVPAELEKPKDGRPSTGDRESAGPVAVIDVVPSYRLGLTAAFQDAGFAPEEPSDLDLWIRLPGRRVLLFTVGLTDDYTIVRRFVQANPALLVIALLRDATPEMYARAVHAGAAGAVPWTSAPEAVVAVVESARQGYVLLPQDVARAIADGVGSSGLPGIRPEEIRWLQMMANNKTVAELADVVGYSEREMFRLLRQLYDRMSVRNRTEALLKAAQCGVLSAP